MNFQSSDRLFDVSRVCLFILSLFIHKLLIIGVLYDWFWKIPAAYACMTLMSMTGVAFLSQYFRNKERFMLNTVWVDTCRWEQQSQDLNEKYLCTPLWCAMFPLF